MNRFRAMWHQASAQGPIIVAGLLLGVSALISAVGNLLDERNEHRNDETDREQIDRLEFELECRSDLTAPIAEIQATKLDALALGLVALERDDEVELQHQIERIELASVEEQKALDARHDAVETCNRRADTRFEE